MHDLILFDFLHEICDILIQKFDFAVLCAFCISVSAFALLMTKVSFVQFESRTLATLAKVEMSETRTVSEVFLDACRNGDEARVNLAIKLGVDVNTGDGEGRTGLMWAIWREQETIVDILLAHRDIDINATTRRGTSPLSLAASRGLTSIVAKLDVRGCWGEPGLVGVNHQGFGRTPLSWATNNGED